MNASADHPGWLLDEVGSAGRENLDADHVSRYDAKEDAHAQQEVELLRSLGLDGSSVVIDLGAGTGQFTEAVAEIAGRVIAVDVSPVMLDALRRKISRSGRTNVEIIRAGFLSYRHSGDPADLVYSRYALHHLPDFWKAVALTRIRAQLRPGGIFRLWDAVYSFDLDRAEQELESWCATGAEDVDADWGRAEIEEHVRDEHSTFSWLLEPMLERAGFAIEDATYAPDRIFASYVARAV